MIENHGIKNLQVINQKLRIQLKYEKLSTKTRKIRLEDLE
jgi:hypothetical protein